MLAHLRCAQSPFQPQTNPDGYISFGTAENYLMWDVMEKKLAACRNIRESDSHYNPTFGNYAFREAMAKFIARKFKFPVNAESLIVANGATAILDMVAYTFADPGEGILVPAPLYPGFIVDFMGRSGVHTVPAYLESANNFRLTQAALEAGWQRAQAQNITLRGLMICSPNNPVGKVLSREELVTAVNFAREKNLHIFFDEIYGNSVFSDDNFLSAMTLPETRAIASRAHFIYGMSKDFALGGFRIGIFHSENPDVIASMRALCSFSNASADSQSALARLLSDERWVDEFIALNHRRLQHAYVELSTRLSKSKIQFHTPRAGIFAWADFRAYLTSPTFEAEAELAERILNEARVNMIPGKIFMSPEPGWFRVCFARPDIELQTAAARLTKVLREDR